MSAISRCLHAATQQFSSIVSPKLLTPSLRVLAVSSALIAASVVPAQAQVAQVLPQSSAGQYGSALGQVVGAVLGTKIAGTDASGPIGQVTQRVVAAIGQEAGGNLVSMAAQAPYGASGASARAPTPAIERNYLDRAALNAISANIQLIHAPAYAYNDSYRQNQRAFSLFDSAYRSTADRGFDVSMWTDVRKSLMQPLGAVPEERYNEYVGVMVDRLRNSNGQAAMQFQQQQQAQQMPQYQYQPIQQGSALSALRSSMAMSGVSMSPVAPTYRP